MTVLEITAYGRNTLRRRRLETRIVDPTAVPELAPAYEIDRLSPSPVLVAEDLPNVSLADLRSISPLPAAAALHALQDVAATLEAMHEQGLAHGDLRAATVLVLPDGRSALARSQTTTPAPGKAREAARRADAHDFATLAFELLTGTHPLAPPNAASMASSFAALPPAAATLLRQALANDPDRRPLPRDLVAALDAIPAEEWPTNHLRRPPSRPMAPPMSPPLVVATHTVPRPRRQEPAASPPPPPPPTAAVEPVAPVAVTVEAAEAAPAVGPEESPDVVVRIVPPRVRRSLFRRILGPFVIILGLLTVAAGGGAGAWLLFTPDASADDPRSGAAPHVRRVSLAVTPPQAQCPRAALHIAATIVTDGGPGDIELHWRLPGGSTAEPHSFAVDAGRTTLRAALELTLTGTNRLRGRVVAIVGPDGARASAPIRYLCPSAPKKDAKRSRSV